ALDDLGSGIVTSLTKTGAGTWTLSGDKTFTGLTTIAADGGTLEVGPEGGKLSGTSGIVVNNGGTLLLSGSTDTIDRLNDAATVHLSGGTLNTGGLNEGSALAVGVGVLTLIADSTLDLGTGSSIFHFAASGSAIWTSDALLTITNWSGSTSGAGTDQLYFGNSQSALTSTQLSQIRFDLGGGNYSGANLLSTGELVPVPEPSTVFGGLTLLGLIGFRERRRLAALWGLAFGAAGNRASAAKMSETH
ncbi:MAG: PEP-CTERM sorting domain-containing protein, partial [Verrucomicrobiaceae bacterium]